MSLLNVAVWGLGSHAINRILPAIFSMNEIKLIGVCSRNNKVVKACAEQWNCYGWNKSDHMLKSAKVDVVYIATPIGVHYACAEQALKAGKHVWCEKPLTCNYADTKKLVSLAEVENKVLTESFMYLYHPQFHRVKKFVENSKRVHSVICRFGIPNLDKPGFRNNPELCGGALWDIATYTTSALFAIFPGQQVEVIFAEVLTKKKSRVDTEGRALLRFSQGATVYIEWGLGISYRNEIDLWSEESTFFTDKIFSKPKGYQPQYEIRDLNGNKSIENGERCEQFIEMFHTFFRIMGDQEKIAAERKIILQRANLINDIVNFNGVSNGKLEEF